MNRKTSFSSNYFGKHKYHVTPELLREIANSIERGGIESLYFTIECGEICERAVRIETEEEQIKRLNEEQLLRQRKLENLKEKRMIIDKEIERLNNES